MGQSVTCSVCGQTLDGRGPGGLAVANHAKMLKQAFVESVGSRPKGYDEVRQWWRGELTLTGQQGSGKLVWG